MSFKEKVIALIESALREYPSLFLIECTIGNDNAIHIVIDGDKGVSIDDCIAISRAVEHNLDREEQDFSLDVSSFGATSPLVMPRQYQKNIGRELQVKTDTENVKGKLISADENQIVLEVQTREAKPQGKGKITVKKEVKISLANIKEAKIVLKF